MSAKKKGKGRAGDVLVDEVPLGECGDNAAGVGRVDDGFDVADLSVGVGGVDHLGILCDFRGDLYGGEVAGAGIVGDGAEEEGFVDLDIADGSAESGQATEVCGGKALDGLTVGDVSFDARAAGGEGLHRGRFDLDREIVSMKKGDDLLEVGVARARNPAGVETDDLGVGERCGPRGVGLEEGGEVGGAVERLRGISGLGMEPDGSVRRNGGGRRHGGGCAATGEQREEGESEERTGHGRASVPLEREVTVKFQAALRILRQRGPNCRRFMNPVGCGWNLK